MTPEWSVQNVPGTEVRGKPRFPHWSGEPRQQARESQWGGTDCERTNKAEPRHLRGDWEAGPCKPHPKLQAHMVCPAAGQAPLLSTGWSLCAPTPCDDGNSCAARGLICLTTWLQDFGPLSSCLPIWVSGDIAGGGGPCPWAVPTCYSPTPHLNLTHALESQRAVGGCGSLSGPRHLLSRTMEASPQTAENYPPSLRVRTWAEGCRKGSDLEPFSIPIFSTGLQRPCWWLSVLWEQQEPLPGSWGHLGATSRQALLGPLWPFWNRPELGLTACRVPSSSNSWHRVDSPASGEVPSALPWEEECSWGLKPPPTTTPW
nr:uncharacterized protein LOC123477889 [Desmodus rotundus]